MSVVVYYSFKLRYNKLKYADANGRNRVTWRSARVGSTYMCDIKECIARSRATAMTCTVV